MWQVVGAFLGFVLFPALCYAADAERDRDVLAAIIKAAQQRQTRCQSVRMVIHYDYWQSPEQAREVQEQLGAVKLPKSYLESGYTVRAHSSFSLDENRVRIHLEGETPTPPTWEPVHNEFLTVFDGRLLMRASPPRKERKYWSIDVREGREFLGSLPLPMAAHVRLRDPQWMHAASTVWGVAEETVRIGKTNCVVVAFGDGISTFAFDPTNDWVLRRYCVPQMSEGKEVAAEEVQIEYSQPKGADSHPISWTQQFRRNGKVHTELRTKVVDWSVAPKWGPETFEIRYPNRSMVTEQTAGDHRQTTGYIIDAKGNLHEATPELAQDGKYLKLLE
ncbi:MAG: hypothetical protein IT428_18530 [Planctomycetaceae bacterium]|nr:hypothetical protein [Planctomycetaceae bacterium]